MRLEQEFLARLSKMPRAGIWALFNDADKMFYLSHSSNMIEGLANLLIDVREHVHPIKAMVFDFEKLRFEVIEVMEDQTTRLMHFNFWMKKLMAEGFSPYREINPLQFKLIIDADKLDSRLHQLYAFVKLKTRNRKYYTVGVFEKMKEATQFVRQCYSDLDEIDAITVATNELTKNFYLNPDRKEETFR